MLEPRFALVSVTVVLNLVIINLRSPFAGLLWKWILIFKKILKPITCFKWRVGILGCFFFQETV